MARIHKVIYGTIDRLPLCGRLHEPSNTREFPVPGLPYVVIYQPDAGRIDIIAVFHTSRDPASKRRT